MNKPHCWLALILAAYLVIGALYAIYTPPWQVPDEPAHYNYIRALATGGPLPLIEMGDYDQAYLNRLVFERHFPPDMSIEPLRYEDWQPPLYYALATPVFWLSNGSLVALRLFSVLLGAGVIVLAFLIARQIAPNHPTLALGTAAFVAFVPQHAAMMAGVNNDSLAELLLAAVMWMVFRISYSVPKTRWEWALIGLLLGVGMITKLTFYIAAPLVAWVFIRCAVCTAPDATPSMHDTRRITHYALYLTLPAAIITLPWWARNVAVYGWPDVMGQMRHNAVVAGQPTTTWWIVRYGWGNYLERFFTFTFQSFWGQFGWTTVVMPPRYYWALGILSLVALAGFAWFLQSRKSIVLDVRFQILGAWVVFNILMYLYYNLTFVQHQGRYLFPSLIPIGLAFIVGVRQWTRLLPRRGRNVILSLPYLGLIALDVIALFRMIVPALQG